MPAPRKLNHRVRLLKVGPRWAKPSASWFKCRRLRARTGRAKGLRGALLGFSAALILAAACGGGESRPAAALPSPSQPTASVPAGTPMGTPAATLPGYGSPVITPAQVSSPTPILTIGPNGPLPEPVTALIREYLAGQGLRLAGACLEITAAPGDDSRCYLVLADSVAGSLRLTLGRWAADHGNVRLTIIRDHSGTYTITTVAPATGQP